MDADDPNEIFVIGLSQTMDGDAMGTAETNPLLIGVHRRLICLSEFQRKPP